MENKIEVLEGEVYYEPKIHQFFCVERTTPEGVVCSGFCHFYEDSRTNIHRQLLSFDFLSKSILVGCIDQFPFAELDPSINAWKVKGYRGVL